MRILIVDQCSSSKEIPDWFEPFDEDDLNEHSLEDLLDRDRVPARPAKDLYQGRQQLYISQAVDRLRAAGDEVDRLFISAGFGVVDESMILPPYNVTFNSRSESVIRERSNRLNIQADIDSALDRTPPYELAFFALGQKYFFGIDLRELINSISNETRFVLFNQELIGSTLYNAISISARTEDAKANGDTVIALKGQFINNFAKHRANGAKVTDFGDILTYCTTEITDQVELGEYEP